MKNTFTRIINGLKALILPIACYLVFLILSGGTFGTPATLLNNAVKSVSPVLLAYGIMMLVVEGNMDMSIGAHVYFTAILGANLAKMWGWGIVGIICICLVISVVICLIKAIVNYFMDISYNMLSIGYMLWLECMTYFIFNAKGAMVIGKVTTIARAPYCLIFLAIGFVAIQFIWSRSAVANHIRAIGSNPARAKLAGMNIKKDEFKAIMIGAPFMAFSAVFFLTNNGLVQAVLNMSSMTLCFDAMIAVFIAMALQRYVSLPIGIIIGVFTIKMLGTGILSLGLPTYVQNIVTGAFLLIFVGITLNQVKLFAFFEERKRAKELKNKYSLS